MKQFVRFVSTKKIWILVAIVAATILYLFVTKKDAPQTNASNASTKYYTCIAVEQGDTLWDIANEYRTEEYASTQDYIDEVLSINNMNTEVIVAGTNLLVPYYKVDTY